MFTGPSIPGSSEPLPSKSRTNRWTADSSEKRAIAALNHPHICTVHDIGPNYLVMELVEGPTLAERISQGPIPVEEALAIARQIADALEAAHERGIIHRDLKPANVKIKADGTVKVLDFGLARRARSAELPDEHAATRTLTITEEGTLAGTPSYMSPEQALGKPIDKRADIWAFGVILYEMLTGRRLFDGLMPLRGSSRAHLTPSVHPAMRAPNYYGGCHENHSRHVGGLPGGLRRRGAAGGACSNHRRQCRAACHLTRYLRHQLFLGFGHGDDRRRARLASHGSPLGRRQHQRLQLATGHLEHR
jgi:serine/threonine protein kinase